MFRFQPDRHGKQRHRGQSQLRQNSGVGDENRSDAAGSRQQNGCGGHQEQVAQFSGHGAGKIKKKKLLLPDDRFHVSPEQIKDEHVPDQVPRPVVQERCSKKLPAVRGVNPAIA